MTSRMHSANQLHTVIVLFAAAVLGIGLMVTAASSLAEERKSTSGAEERKSTSGAEERKSTSGAEERYVTPDTAERKSTSGGQERKVTSDTEKHKSTSDAQESKATKGTEEKQLTESGKTQPKTQDEIKQLEEDCKAGTQAKLTPLRQARIDECVKNKEKPGRASCENFYRDFGERTPTGKQTLHYDVPACAELYKHGK